MYILDLKNVKDIGIKTDDEGNIVEFLTANVDNRQNEAKNTKWVHLEHNQNMVGLRFYGRKEVEFIIMEQNKEA